MDSLLEWAFAPVYEECRLGILQFVVENVNIEHFKQWTEVILDLGPLREELKLVFYTISVDFY